MISKFRFWLAWLLLPTEDKFRSHYYLMFWQEACFWSPKQWRKVHKRALVRVSADFDNPGDMSKVLDTRAMQWFRSASKNANSRPIDPETRHRRRHGASEATLDGS